MQWKLITKTLLSKELYTKHLIYDRPIWDLYSMKHRHRHGHGHVDTWNVENVGHGHDYIYIIK